MKSPRPIIFNEEIRELPDRAGAALAYRAIARTMEILPFTGSERWPDEAIELADRLTRQLDAIARGAEFPPHSFVLGHDGYKASQAILDQFKGGSHSRVAWLCVQAGMTASGIGAQDAFGWCKSLVWYISPRTESKKAERIVANANWDDFCKLRLMLEVGELTDQTPVLPDSLGPLWPKGPHDWAQFAWCDSETMDEIESKQATGGQEILDSLVPHNENLNADVRDALDRTATARGDGWRHAFTVHDEAPTRKWPAALRNPASPIAEQLLAFYRFHGWGALFIPPGHREGLLWIVPAEVMNAQRAEMLQWDSALDCFDPKAIEEANRYSESIGMEPDARLAPCSKRDLLVFAKVHASPNAFFIVTKGSEAGKVFFFDHETGIDFDDPIAESLAGWIDALGNPERDWDWLSEDGD